MPCDVEDMMVSSGYPYSPLRSFERLDLSGSLSPTISVYGGGLVCKPKIFEKASLCVIDLGIEDFLDEAVKFENKSDSWLYLSQWLLLIPHLHRWFALKVSLTI